MNKVFIIAEAGVNHNGDLKLAKKLIDIAVDAGADAVKFQTFKAENLVTKSALKAKYQQKNTSTNKLQFTMLKKLELSINDFKNLFAYCEKKNIIFISTPFAEESADMLDNLGMTIFKIPSGEITNKFLIQHIAAKNKKIILSTGMASLNEIDKAVNWIYEVNSKPRLTLLHCTSNYPAAIEDVNLLAIKTMKKVFGLPIGYSDHTLGMEISIAAVTLGATVIEKHFTLDKNLKGPDHKMSLEPPELKAMIKAIRNVEKAMGDGVKKPALSEKNVKEIVRKSLVAKRDIKAGEVIKLNDLNIKRPGTGISPEFKEIIVGMQIKKNVKADTVIKWEDFKEN